MCLEHIPLQFYLSLFMYTLLHTILLLLGPHLFLFFKTYWVQLLLPVAMLTHLADLIMCKSCPGNHSCSGFIRATTAMCSPKESISEHYFDLLLFYSFCPSVIVSRALCWQADNVFHLGLSTQQHVISAVWPFMSLCIAAHWRRRLLWPVLRTLLTWGRLVLSI